jgi:dienelactone hydrolase
MMCRALKSPLLAVLACLVSWSVAAQSPGPQGTAQGAQREQTWRIPAAGGSPLMIATVMRPPGEDKRPLAVINHGSPVDGSQRSTMARPRYQALSSWFVARGYVVVLPERRGYGETGGAWAETYGPCSNPDYYDAGLQGASDIRATVDFMRTQPFVAADRTIVVGQSAGGWATLALSSLNPPGVSGMIDFAGGRGGEQRLQSGGFGNCAPDVLVRSAGKYGATARVPLLWIATANDRLFAPDLVRRMVDAYNGAGGRATYRPLGAFGHDGHNLAASDNGVSMWSGPVADFLAGLK